jgi:hypothetical protein
MGFLSYQAISPTSGLYTRLQYEKAFRVLTFHLFLQGNGIFHIFQDEPIAINKMIEDIIKGNHGIFGSELEASLIVAEFRDELRITSKAYPGIANRRASLEKTSDEIEERLSQKLSRINIENANDIVKKLVFGDKIIGENILQEEDTLDLISRELVRKGASIFRQIDPEELFERDDSWEESCLEDLAELKDLYILADERDEEILMSYD